MKKISFVLIFAWMLAACGEGSGAGNGKDSVNTDTMPDPSYNPRVQTDSVAKQMNLDSIQLKDSVAP